jgi:glutathione S-transferase
MGMNTLHSWTVSALCWPRGMYVAKAAVESPPRPAQLLELYEFEACPFCRKVRAVMSELDLEYVSRACPKGAAANRAALKERGGKEQLPFLVDPNEGCEIYESEAIIDYLYSTYGAGRPGSNARILSPVFTVAAISGSLVRPKGGQAHPVAMTREQPEELLVLYNFELSPYCRKVRETLCELNLDVLVKNVAKGSKRRPELVERGGRMMVPFLIDPNTDTELYESDVIVEYLRTTYG